MTPGEPPARPDRIDIAPGAPHLWLIDIHDDSFMERGARPGLVEAGLVSPVDEERAAGLLDPRAGVRLRARRVVLREVLAAYVGCGPDEVGLVTAPGGKPVLRPGSPGSATHAFSVGHSGHLYVIGVGRGSSLGCDVEQLRPVPRAAAIAERWFGRAEAEGLAGLEGGRFDRAFMELWTDKEALAKRHGAGLRLMKGQADAPDVHDELDVSRERKAGRLVRVDVGADYVGAVASTDAIDQVEVIGPEDERWII